MRERGRYQIQLMKTRSSSGVGQKIDLEFDVDSLRIRDLAEDDSGQNYGSSGNSTIYNSLKKTSTVIDDNATDSSESQEKVPNPTKGQSLHKAGTDNADQTKLRDFLKNLDGDE
jgi:hypothetical protein